MQLNSDIFEILKEKNIPKSAGVLFLLAIYYDLDTDELALSEEVISAINLTGIVERDYEKKTIEWRIPLFLGQETEWNWVVEWNNRWKVEPSRKASNPDVLKRMKNFFKLYPHIRKVDVLSATDLYFSRTNRGYLKNSAAFIFDGVGTMKKSILLGYCEMVLDKNKRIEEGKQDPNQKGKVIT